MSNSQFRSGMRVRAVEGSRYFGQFGTVDKVLQKNVDVTMDGGRRVRFDPSLITPDNTPPGAAPALQPFPIPAPAPVVGTVVTVAHDKVVGPHVVIGEGTRQGQPTVKVAKLGGDASRYWSLPARSLTVVPLEELAALLPAMAATS